MAVQSLFLNGECLKLSQPLTGVQAMNSSGCLHSYVTFTLTHFVSWAVVVHAFNPTWEAGAGGSEFKNSQVYRGQCHVKTLGMSGWAFFKPYPQHTLLCISPGTDHWPCSGLGYFYCLLGISLRNFQTRIASTL